MPKLGYITNHENASGTIGLGYATNVGDNIDIFGNKSGINAIGNSFNLENNINFSGSVIIEHEHKRITVSGNDLTISELVLKSPVTFTGTVHATVCKIDKDLCSWFEDADKSYDNAGPTVLGQVAFETGFQCENVSFV